MGVWNFSSKVERVNALRYILFSLSIYDERHFDLRKKLIRHRNVISQNSGSGGREFCDNVHTVICL